MADTGLASPAEVRALLAFPLSDIGLDCETTALSPSAGRVRLLSLSDGTTSLVMDCWEHPLDEIFPYLVGHTLIIHNSLFDISWLVAAGMRNIPDCHDTYLISCLLDGAGHPAGHHSLAGCCKRWLGLDLPKDLQQSDWSGPLTAEQIEYNRRDAAVLAGPRGLLERMRAECGRRGLRVLKLTWGK